VQLLRGTNHPAIQFGFANSQILPGMEASTGDGWFCFPRQGYSDEKIYKLSHHSRSGILGHHYDFRQQCNIILCRNFDRKSRPTLVPTAKTKANMSSLYKDLKMQT